MTFRSGILSLTGVAGLAPAQHNIFPGGMPHCGFSCLQTLLLSDLKHRLREHLVCQASPASASA